MKLYLIIPSMLFCFAAGLPVGGLFFGPECPEQIVCMNDDEDEMLVSDLETTPSFHWFEYTDGTHRDTIYAVDGADNLIMVFSDGQVYRGKNRVVLSKQHRRRVKILYDKLKTN